MENEGVTLHFPLCSAFLALPLEGDAAWRFQALQEELKQFDEFLSFQNPRTPHLTLYFWKELLKIEYDSVLTVARAIAARTQPFTLRITGAETFGRVGEERVLFLGIAFSPKLATIKKLCPWPNPPGQPFHPHITLARITHPQRFAVYRKKILKIFEDCAFDVPVDRLRLYADIDRVKQTPIGDFPLHGGRSERSA